MSILAGWGRDAIAAAAGPAPHGAILPPPGELPTVGGQLANGATMIFYSGDVELTLDPNRRIAPDYLVWLHGELAKQRLELTVLIVPTKYQVYGPLMHDPSAPRPHDDALRRLADDLTARGVFAVNVTDALRRQAAEDLRRGEYDYFLDDTHWSDRGIAAAAGTFVEAWKRR
jgi:acetyltransferase AlgX (SGNH hydrolase-like protein)